MKTSQILISLLFFLLTGVLYGQKKDFGIWYEIDGEKSLNKRFDLEVSGVIRTFKNGSKIDQAFLEAGASYSLNKYLGFAASYRIGNYVEDDDLYHIRHKWFGDVKGSLPVGRLHLSARLRLQIVDKTYVENQSDTKVEYDGRIKLRAIYKISGFPIDPYLSFESFSPLFRSSDRFIEKSRSTFGLEYKINKRNYIDAEYIYQRDNSPHLSIMNIISLSYLIKF